MEIMEDLEVIKEQTMDVFQDLADLERERDKEANKLRRRSRQTILRIIFSELEDGYHYRPLRSSSQFIPCSHNTAFLLQ